MGVWGQSPTPIICQDGAQELIKIDEEIGGEGVRKSSGKFFKMIDPHQYQQALCVFKRKKWAGVLFA